MISRVASRLLIPAAALLTDQGELNCKPSELPIYTEDKPKEKVKPPHEPGLIEQEIGKARRQVWALTKNVDDAKERLETWYVQGYDQVSWLVNYLREEDNTTPKAGAIAVGGLTGYILALRGGFFRKLIFTTAGALSMAAVCYPKEAAEYTKLAQSEAKRYVRIGYNFYHGVKKDDPPLELPSLPKIPTSFSEVLDLVKGSSSNSSDKTVLGEKEKEQVGGISGGGVLLSISDAASLNAEVDPMSLVTQIHKEAIHDNCHCPVGTCLNPKDESPNPSSGVEDDIPDPSELPFCD